MCLIVHFVVIIHLEVINGNRVLDRSWQIVPWADYPMGKEILSKVKLALTLDKTIGWCSNILRDYNRMSGSVVMMLC